MTDDLVVAPEADGAALGLLPMALAKPVTASELFSPGTRETIMVAIKAHVAKVPLDASTEFGRTQLQETKTKLVRSRTGVERLRKEHIAAARKIIADAGAIGDAYEADFKALEAIVDAPLAAYKQIERDRVAGHNAALQALCDLAVFPIGTEATVAEIEARIAEIQPATQRNWQEFSVQASEAWQAATATLNALLETTRRREAEAAELAELRRLKAESDRIKAHHAAIAVIANSHEFAIGSGSGPDGAVTAADVVARIAAVNAPDPRDWEEFADAAEGAREDALAVLRGRLADLQAAEAEARANREAAVAREAAERAQADAAAALRAAEERAANAESDRRAALEAAAAAAEQAKIDAQAERDAAVAEAVRKATEAALAPPVNGVTASSPAERYDEAARISRDCGGPPPRIQRPPDNDQKREVHASALAAFVAGGLKDKDARLAVTLIAGGKIPAVTITY